MFFSAFILTSAMAVQPAPPRMPDETEQSVAQLLADQWMRTARAIMANEPVTVEKIEVSTLLAQMAAEKAPRYDTAWRFVLTMADFGEQRDLQRAAVERLATLAPTDEVIRLRRLNQAIDELDTAEEREALYERLLAPERRAEVGPAVASRLALDLALLKQAQGDLDSFSKWLAEATAIDASNRKAAALAAGFFRANVEDPAAEAELLISLTMADPTDAMSMLTLAQLLLEHGAFDSAERLYRLSLKVAQLTGNPTITDDLIADAAIAQWGHGDATSALRMILEHQRIRDQIIRAQMKKDNDALTPLDLAKEHAMLSPTLCSVRAMIQRGLGGELAARALQETIASYDNAIAQAGTAETADPATQARLLLEQASVMFWLGADIEEAASRVAQAAALSPLTPEAQARFDGWKALRQGDTAKARATLEPLANDDPLAAIGFALALIEEGERKESARQLLAVARRQPGTLLGVWAYDTLTTMLGQRFTVSETARKLDQLVAKMPAVFDRYVDDPSLAVSLRVLPTKVRFSPFEPLTLNIEITNHTNVPMGIDREGPIRPHVALIASPQVAGVRLPRELKPFIVDIDRKLRLEPHERMVITVDLRQSSLAMILDTQALRGATITVRALMNFMVTPQGALRPAILGSEVVTERIRVDGVRVTRDWLQEVLGAIMQPDSVSDLIQLALLAPVAGAGAGENAPADDKQLLDDAFTALIDAFPKLSPTAQAWLIGVAPKTARMEQIRAMARRSNDPGLILSYLIHQSTGVDDPMFDTARRGDNATLRELAEKFEFAILPQENESQ